VTDQPIQEDLRDYARTVEEHSAHPLDDPWVRLLTAGADRIDDLEAALRAIRSVIDASDNPSSCACGECQADAIARKALETPSVPDHGRCCIDSPLCSCAYEDGLDAAELDGEKA
jgi:hypothetical protein